MRANKTPAPEESSAAGSLGPGLEGWCYTDVIQCQPGSLYVKESIFIHHFSVSSGNEKHDLHVIPQQGSSEPLVQDLAQVVEDAIGVPLPLQKLIFKGRHLFQL